MRQRPRGKMSSRPYHPCGPYPGRATAAQRSTQSRRPRLFQQNLYDAFEPPALACRCHPVVRGTRLLAGALDPAATEGPVQIDEAGEALQARRDERELGVVEGGLRDEHVQIRVRAVAIAEVRKLQAALLRRREALLCGKLLVVGAARSRASAWRMSGRRVSRSDGSPAGMSARIFSSPMGNMGGRSAGSDWPNRSTRPFSACARARTCAALVALACSTMDCAWRRVSSGAVPVSNCSFTILYEACAVSSVCLVTASCSSNASIVRY